MSSWPTTSPEPCSSKDPPKSKGKQIGMWYAKKAKNKENERKDILFTGPDVTLADEKIGDFKRAIKSYEMTTSFRATDIKRPVNTDFSQLLFLNIENYKEKFYGDLDEELAERFKKHQQSEDYIAMNFFRMNLPAYKSKDEILQLINMHQVILIKGNTGSGKTTQVCQYILDNALINKKGTATKIICVVPKRIAAKSIAERVAVERAESLGNSIGYQIRLEKELPQVTANIMFCTPGVLLRFMQSDPALLNYSHIIIDEIHERNSRIDLCLAFIKQIVQQRKDLKIILMSATLNDECFSRYFNSCPIILIEGSTYEVEELFLEDVLERTEYNNFSQQKSEPAWIGFKNKKKKENSDDEFQRVVGNYAKSLRGKYPSKIIKNMLNPETEIIDEKFIENVIFYISSNEGPGAILCILPGYNIISKLYDSLTNSPNFPCTKFVIYAVHSMLTGGYQKNIFITPPEGIRKIILATPLVETSVTINDVVYVINPGKVRIPYFDFETNATVLEDQWITKANETQRKGRAGRVQKGFCYHLYSKGRSVALEEFVQPEILRIRLEEILLTIKVLCIKDVRQFMSTFIDVPDNHVITSSIKILQRLGALDDAEELTPLGLCLAQIAAPPQIGKMLLLSSIFSCFDPISSAASALSFQSPFFSVMGKEQECNEAKRQFSNDSDQLAVVGAMKFFKTEKNSPTGVFIQKFLSTETMESLEQLKTEFAHFLEEANFLSGCDSGCAENNQNSDDIDVIRAVICGGFYPNVGYRLMKVSNRKNSECIKTAGKRVKLHPSCVLYDQSTYDPGFLVYFQLTKLNEQMIITDTTANVNPYAILMFEEQIKTKIENKTHYITVGDMAQFKCSHETAYLILELRETFEKLLQKKFQSPSPIVWDSAEGKLLKVIVELFAFGRNLYKDYTELEDDDDDE